jgi:DNA-binding NtrC family response regulator
MTPLLILEDDRSFVRQLERFLPKDEFSIKVAANIHDALSLVSACQFDVALTDLYLGGERAFDFIAELRNLDRHLPVIVMTSKHTANMAIKAGKHGAYDYFPKPAVSDYRTRKWVDELADALEEAAGKRRLMERVAIPGETRLGERSVERMLGRSRVMREVFKAIGRAAATDVTVLIRGETGTGKELTARALYSHSHRSDRPFIVVNSAAIPETLLESELFGHEKGAFTNARGRRIGRFEQAEGGTIFLDEIGDIGFPLQKKLLRVLQEKTIERVGGRGTIPVNVRVIAATSRDLESAIEAQEFRSDLYFRLNVGVITLPLLRERPDDIEDLVKYFWEKHGPEFGCGADLSLEEGALSVLKQQPWPGNVRQLRNVVRKLLLLSHGFPVTVTTVEKALAQMEPPQPAGDQTFQEFIRQMLDSAVRGEGDNLQEQLDDYVDKELFAQAIRLAEGDQSKAARWLGVSRPTMLEKLRTFKLHSDPSAS